MPIRVELFGGPLDGELRDLQTSASSYEALRQVGLRTVRVTYSAELDSAGVAQPDARGIVRMYYRGEIAG